MDQINKWNVAHSLTKRKLLIAINSLAALSIFFFGYDQGMMVRISALKPPRRYVKIMLKA
jgi:hypothetical protein